MDSVWDACTGAEYILDYCGVALSMVWLLMLPVFFQPNSPDLLEIP